jgi:bla regulator protein BlaR1
VIAWAIETLVATTLLMLLVLAIRAPVRRAFGPGVAYALWLLPVFRMLLPPIPESWQAQAEAAAAPVAAASEAITVYVIEPMGAAPEAGAEGSFGWLMAVLLLWAAGALVFLGYHLVSHSRFCNRLLKRARVDRTVARGRVRVIETDAAHGPLAFGIWRKYVAFPRDFSERYDEVERDLALAHELGHHVRGDLIANWVALVMLALHWFNPVAWKAFRAFRADQEMACDALVLAGRAQALRHAYGRAIVKSAHGGAVSAACHLHTINELKGRLKMLSKNRKTSPMRFAAGMAGVGALSLAALGLTASGTQAAERIKDKVESTIGVELPEIPEIPEIPAIGEIPAIPAIPGMPRQDAPPAPDAPDAPEAPEPPEPPSAPDSPKIERRVMVVTGDGKELKDGKGKRYVFRDVRNGEHGFEMDLDEIMASVPDVKSANCGTGDGKQPIVRNEEGGKKRIMIICTDRIERMSANAEKMAKVHVRLAERHKVLGMRTALGSLRHARASVARDGNLDADEKARALKGIDEAIRELEKEIRED